MYISSVLYREKYNYQKTFGAQETTFMHNSPRCHLGTRLY